MTEIDERTLTEMIEAKPRYQGDRTRYAPNMSTVHGFKIGRSLEGKAVGAEHGPVHSGALQVFIPGHADLPTCESIITEHCDHAQIHPAVLWVDGESTYGRGYWIRSALPKLYALAQFLADRLSMSPVLMVPPEGVEPPTEHGRVIVPFVDGVIGKSIMNPDELDWLRQTLSQRRRHVLEHLDFNGTHFGMQDSREDVLSCIGIVRERYEVSTQHNLGMSHFQSDLLNVESYPVVVL